MVWYVPLLRSLAHVAQDRFLRPEVRGVEKLYWI